MGKLDYGTNVEVLGAENGWYQIRFGDGVGYVFSDYVLHTATSVQTEPEAPAAEESAPTAGENILAYAKNFLGVPYRYGGSSPSGFDCSGFVKFVYGYFGVNLPRTSYSQMQSGYAVSTDALQPGDLLFFRGGGHVGIYAGDNMYIHAPQTGRTVSVDPIDRTIIAARRIF
ncbi:MAG: C40 family peptidase [Clostridia bacterium]|nr:C40 family peptidase [Clostridia bacterium]